MSVQAITAVRTGAETLRAGAEALRSSTSSAATAPAEPAQEAKLEREAPAHEPAAPRADPPPDPQAAFATSQYLVGLLAAQSGVGSGQVARPAHITPERLSALVEFLESHVPHRTAPARRQSVDASA